jgi:UDP-N-acetylmuramoyl-tripeptide--D-alanyl-D-alanine ligase
MLTLGHVIEALTGYQAGGGRQIITDVVIDPRLAIPGALFIALPGDEMSDRGRVAAAFEKGASVALVQRDLEAPALPCQMLDLREPVTHAQVAALEPPLCMRVEDTLKAMQTLAAFWRRRLQLRVIGVTGSVGKTTTKELIAAVLSTRYRTFKSEGNYQHEVSLPLMLLKLTEAHERAVVEMGFYHPGEIKFMAELARPQVGVVNNVYAVHLERAGSLDALARGKAELVEALPPEPEGVAVLNADDPLVLAMGQRTRARVITYGLDRQADLWADNIESAGLDGVRFHLHYRHETLHVHVPLLGRHSVHTALRAAAVGLVEGLTWQDILDGLNAVGATQLRLVAVTGPEGSVILDDTYSASPESVIAALNLLVELEGRHVAVLGDMLELGSYEEMGHRLVGRRARDVVDLLVTVGPRARVIASEAREAGLPAAAVVELDDSDAAIAFLRQTIRRGDVVLLKGSQGVKLDRVVPALEVRPPEPKPDAGLM